MDQVWWDFEAHAALFQGVKYRVNIPDLEIDQRAALPRSVGLRDADQQPYVTGLEKTHLRWGGEQKLDPEDVAVECGGPFQILDRNEQLPYCRV